MSKPTNEPSREPICKPTNDQINDQKIHEMNEQTEVPLQQLGTHANVSQQLVPAADSEGATLASKTGHQLPTITTHATTSEPIVSHSPFQRHETIATHATKSMRPLQLMPQQSETIVPHSTKQSETIRTCSTNQIK